jgi:SAM-dependent methyltransferase
MPDPISEHNRAAWDLWSEQGDRWTTPVSPETIARARRGEWEVYLTESRPVPREWFPDLAGARVLCLASGGGQQGPILAAAGARVTVFDNSPRQLEADRLVAGREGLELETVQGDMRDLSVFPDASFELVFHPTANLFIPDLAPLWQEAYRVLIPGGVLLAGFLNPFEYMFDRSQADQGVFVVRHALPYSDLTSISAEERRATFGEQAPLEFSHTLEEQIGGQLAAGFVLTGLFESHREDQPIAAFMPSYLATRAIKSDLRNR